MEENSSFDVTGGSNFLRRSDLVPFNFIKQQNKSSLNDVQWEASYLGRSRKSKEVQRLVETIR